MAMGGGREEESEIHEHRRLRETRADEGRKEEENDMQHEMKYILYIGDTCREAGMACRYVY